MAGILGGVGEVQEDDAPVHKESRMMDPAVPGVSFSAKEVLQEVFEVSGRDV